MVQCLAQGRWRRKRNFASLTPKGVDAWDALLASRVNLLRAAQQAKCASRLARDRTALVVHEAFDEGSVELETEFRK